MSLLINVDFAYNSSNSTKPLFIRTSLTSPLNFLIVNVTYESAGPFISLIASSSFIPIILTGSLLSSCATFKIISPISKSLSFHIGPPTITSTILTFPSVFWSLAPIPVNLPEIFVSNLSFSSGLKYTVCGSS